MALVRICFELGDRVARQHHHTAFSSYSRILSHCITICLYMCLYIHIYICVCFVRVCVTVMHFHTQTYRVCIKRSLTRALRL